MVDPSLSWLERANRLALVSEQLSTAIHDVNNALQVINGSAELLQHSPDADEVTRRAETIEAHAQRAMRLLVELSGFVRDTNHQIERIDLRDVVDRALTMRRQALVKRRIVVEAPETPAGSGPASKTETTANARRVLQIVLNLIVNAEHALAGRPNARLGIEVGRTSAGAAIVVEDNGPGLTGATTDPMRAAPEVQTLGIGLEVSKALAVEMGGELTHAAGEHGGACWTLRLP